MNSKFTLNNLRKRLTDLRSPVFTHLISADELKSGVTSLPDFVILKKNLTDQPESNLHIVSLVVTVAILLGLLIKFRK